MLQILSMVMLQVFILKGAKIQMTVGKLLRLRMLIIVTIHNLYPDFILLIHNLALWSHNQIN